MTQISLPRLKSSFIITASAALLLTSAAFGMSGTPALAVTQNSGPALGQVPPGTNTTASTAANKRAKFGLRSDDAYVAQVAKDPTATTDVLGIPLLPNERKDLLGRNALASKIPAIAAALTPLGIYGGGWIDHPAGGKLNIAITVPPTAAIKSTVEQIVQGQPVTFTVTNVPERVLIDVQNRLSHSPEWSSTKIQSAMVMVQTSSVDVEIATDAPQSSESILRTLYGPTLKISRTSNKNIAAANPVGRNIYGGQLFGGEWLSGGGQDTCTDGYSNVRDSIGRYYTITAGHCFLTSGQDVYQGAGNSVPIGQASSSTVYDGASTDCDCEVIGQIPPGTGAQSTYIDNNDLYTFTHAGNSVETDIVCEAGARSYETNGGHNECAAVVTIHGTFTINLDGGGSYQLYDCVFTDLNVQFGDSGAPVGRGDGLQGFISFRHDGGGGGYSKAQNVGSSNVHLGF